MTRLNPGGQPFENLIPLGRMGQTSESQSPVPGRARDSFAQTSADPDQSGYRQRSHVSLLASSIVDQWQCHGTSLLSSPHRAAPGTDRDRPANLIAIGCGRRGRTYAGTIRAVPRGNVQPKDDDGCAQGEAVMLPVALSARTALDTLDIPVQTGLVSSDAFCLWWPWYSFLQLSIIRRAYW